MTQDTCQSRRLTASTNNAACTALPPDFSVTVLLIGDFTVGKTSLMLHLSGKMKCSKPVERYCPMSLTVQMKRGHKMIKMKVTDTGGQEKFRSLTASYYRGAHGCLILFDVTKESTFDNLPYWLHDLKEYSTHPEISTILVGTKCHVPPEQRQVTFERAQKYAESVGLPYMEVSAEEGKNVTEVFEKLADNIIETITKSQNTIIVQSPPIKINETKPKQSFCNC